MPGLGYEMADIVEGTWRSFLDAEVVAAVPATLEVSAAGAVAAVVGISGAWNGAIALRCPEALARLAWRRRSGLAGEATPEQQSRILGELALMIAEAFKQLLPAPTALSASTAAPDAALPMRLPGSAQVLHNVFVADGHVFGVTVFQRLPETR